MICRQGKRQILTSLDAHSVAEGYDMRMFVEALVDGKLDPVTGLESREDVV